jgi:hypothetical protein
MKNAAPEILNAASNLLGFCFILLTSLKFFKLSEQTLVDELVAFALVLFIASCVLAFLSIRRAENSKGKIEKAAEYTFLGGLVLLFCTVIMFSFNFIH